MTITTEDQFNLGVELRRLRTGAGHTVRSAAPLVGVSGASISRIENGQRPCSDDEIEKLLATYQASADQRAQVLQLLEAAKAGSATAEGVWWMRFADVLPAGYLEYIRLENFAKRSTEAQTTVLPGLLQTEKYAREITNRTYVGPSAKEVVFARMERQKRLTADPPLSFTGIITEACLRTEVGGPYLMRDQMKHLVELARRENVEVIVIPFASAAGAGLASTFTLFEEVGRWQLDDQSTKTALSEEGAILMRAITWDRTYVERARNVINHLRQAGLDPNQSVEVIQQYVSFWGERD
ncbi:helix-turn-helix domain-containing protein [Embleya sp. NPDC059259]|uniref:helix-turn-helix domain-containing protein n=1 Tax=unclassified Embleya TaxID=2699296 RepID=UPI003676BD93